MKKLIRLTTYGFLKTILAVMLLICLLDMPYGYYQLVRIVSFVLFGYFAYIQYRRKQVILFLVFLIASLMFNPIIKVTLGKLLWQTADVIFAGLLLVTVTIDMINRKKAQS